MEKRQVHAFSVDPLTVNFPFARSLIVVRSQRTIKKTGHSSTESRYYLRAVRPTTTAMNNGSN